MSLYDATPTLDTPTSTSTTSSLMSPFPSFSSLVHRPGPTHILSLAKWGCTPAHTGENQFGCHTLDSTSHALCTGAVGALQWSLDGTCIAIAWKNEVSVGWVRVPPSCSLR